MYKLLLPSITLALFTSPVVAQDLGPTYPPAPPDPMRLENGFSYTAGIALTTRLNTSDSFEHAENEVEGFVELTFGQYFHTALILTSLYQDPTDDFEYEINFGYGREFGNGMAWDLTYGYIGLNDSDDDAHELTGTVFFPLTDMTEGYFAVILDPEDGDSDQEIGFETALDDRWGVFGLVGNSDRDDNFYTEVGVSYALTENVGFEVLYEDTNDSDGLLGFTVAYEFGG